MDLFTENLRETIDFPLKHCFGSCKCSLKPIHWGIKNWKTHKSIYEPMKIHICYMSSTDNDFGTRKWEALQIRNGELSGYRQKFPFFTETNFFFTCAKLSRRHSDEVYESTSSTWDHQKYFPSSKTIWTILRQHLVKNLSQTCSLDFMRLEIQWRLFWF